MAVSKTLLDELPPTRNAFFDCALETWACGKDFVNATRTKNSSISNYGGEIYNEDAEVEIFSGKPLDGSSLKAKARESALERGLEIISGHISSAGARIYYVTSWPKFHKSINVSKSMLSKSGVPSKTRSFYENIYRTSTSRPYVDIDLDISEGVSSLDKNSPSFIQDFEDYVSDLRSLAMTFVASFVICLEEACKEYGVKVTEIFVMDATNQKKFSNHVVFHLDDDSTKLTDSGTLKKIVQYVRHCSNLSELEGKDQERNPFFWPKCRNSPPALKKFLNGDPFTKEEEESFENVKKTSMFDLAVYGNTSREFRILGSTKCGELLRHLKLILRYVRSSRSEEGEGSVPSLSEFVSVEIEEQYATLDFDLFSRCLVCFTSRDVAVKSLIDFEVTESLVKTLETVALEVMQQCGGEEERSTKRGRAAAAFLENATKKSSCQGRREGSMILYEDQEATMAMMEASKHSFPPVILQMYEDCKDQKLVEYVASMIATSIKMNEVSLVNENLYPTSFSTVKGHLIMAFGSSSKYCKMAGRDHTSNHVFYTANLKRRTYSQKCWSPSCIAQKNEENVAREEAAREEELRSVLKRTADDDGNPNGGKRRKLSEENDAASIAMNFINAQGGQLFSGRQESCKGDPELLPESTWQTVDAFVSLYSSLISYFKNVTNSQSKEQTGSSEPRKASLRLSRERTENETRKETERAYERNSWISDAKTRGDFTGNAPSNATKTKKPNDPILDDLFPDDGR